ncbi:MULTISPECIES: hypothetical protein [Mycobacterium]|uniref:Uncharacterized protein n=1 Tax=Mycobacterium kiyosense TaxID=2871094 RepID=A0A9P3Q7P1_9MYCO|nr:MULTISPECIES: hypothetical protein [Mycobacterium]BDB43583.1 hypothetical protein IWGMT90018_40290 [Mycobacterium kiyosense]BDE13260.1 hypothetical protein MKCMC460_21200 [Mycobacterium sp. 20KCMC460]GLB83883.1 hypothetical protein SRL2020028_31390 [Mycobacterium kiyosense]GLB91978.1 hypothetical protein SRL2020130_47950 [Mycobacterium kiyosense]GLB96479.1 hypothetical protein SRL2020226_32550 [Mycobacterium kiyosense]
MPDTSGVDLHARPRWMRTGYRYFPYAARQSGQWWVLRVNYDFPAHDLYTLFIDGTAVGDVTGDPDHPAPLIAGIGSLKWADRLADEPALDPATAAAVVGTVAQYADYGSERGDPCIFCDGNDGLEKNDGPASD